MTIIDSIIIIIFMAFLARGIWVGLVRQLAFIVALLLGFWVAGQYYEAASPILSNFISSPQISFIVTYSLLLVTVYFLVMLLGLGLKKVMQVTFLGWFDRLMGGLFGAGKGVIVISMVFMVIGAFLSDSNKFFKDSFFYPYLSQSSKIMLQLIKDEDLRSGFIPREPAIPNILSLPADILALPVQIGKETGGDAKQKPQENKLVN